MAMSCLQYSASKLGAGFSEQSWYSVLPDVNSACLAPTKLSKQWVGDNIWTSSPLINCSILRKACPVSTSVSNFEQTHGFLVQSMEAPRRSVLTAVASWPADAPAQESGEQVESASSFTASEGSVSEQADRAAAEAVSLQEKFGSSGLTFGSAAGLTVAQLTLSDGSKAKLVTNQARVTSYRPKMWHGGTEEALFTAAREEGEKGNDPLVGGMAVDISILGGLTAGKSPVCDEELGGSLQWAVVAAHNEAQEWIKVVMAPREKPANPSNGSDSSIDLTYTVILMRDSLGAVLSLDNRSPSPVLFTASIATSFSINSNAGVSLVGLKDYEYILGAAEASHKKKGVRGLGGWLANLNRWRPRSNGRDERREQEGSSASSRISPASEGDKSKMMEGGNLDDEEDGGKARLADRAESHSSRLGVNGAQAGDESAPAPQRESEPEAAGSSGTPDLGLGESRIGQFQGGKLVPEGDEFVSMRGPLERLYRDPPQWVTLLDRGKRRSFELESRGFSNLLVTVLGKESGLKRADKSVSLAATSAIEPISLPPQQHWKAAQIVRSLGSNKD